LLFALLPSLDSEELPLLLLFFIEDLIIELFEVPLSGRVKGGHIRSVEKRRERGRGVVA
jgi:hypothetical protein